MPNKLKSESNPNYVKVVQMELERWLRKGFVEQIWVLSLQWEAEWVIDWLKTGTVMRWYAQDEVNQEESEHNEAEGMKKGADSTGKVMHLCERAVGDL